MASSYHMGYGYFAHESYVREQRKPIVRSMNFPKPSNGSKEASSGKA